MSAFVLGPPTMPKIVPTNDRHPAIQLANPSLIHRQGMDGSNIWLSVPSYRDTYQWTGTPNVVSPWVGEENRIGDPRYGKIPMVVPH
jgi:hypothetical protein